MRGLGRGDGTNPIEFSDLRVHAVAWALVFAGHLAIGLLIARMTAPALRVLLPMERLTMIPLAPVPRATLDLSLSVTLLPIDAIAPSVPLLGTLEDENGAAATTPGRSGTIPPHPDQSFQIDTTAFAHQAGLHKNAGVTVVLRVEVRGSGAVARVEVDVSGGSRRIDRAAIAYVRSMKWVGGRVDDQSQTIWVRWAVRLDG